MRSEKTTNRRKSRTVLLIVLLLVLAVIFGGVLYFQMMTDPVSPASKKSIVVEIPQGSTTTSIGSVLEKNGLIRSASAFGMYSKLTHRAGQYQAGTYSLRASMSMKEIASAIAEGKVSTSSFTIPEGYNEYEVAEKLAKDGLADEKKFIRVVEHTDFSKEFSFLNHAQKGIHRLEGYLFPSTYSVPLQADEKYIVRTMLKGYQSTFTDQYRARAKKMGYSERQILTIASIVERESGNEKDKTKVASVIYNRLDAGMPLQMDSTVQYVLKLQGKNPDKLLYDDLKVKSRYNTYLNTGLPPAPICSPGAKSIRAALYPAKTKYLYFVLSDKLDGSSVFSEDYASFQQNSARYHRAVAKQESK